MERPVPALLKVLGQAPPFPYGERAIPALQKCWDRPLHSLMERESYPSASNSAGTGSFHKGTERPILALLKVLGQVPIFPYGERHIPVLLEALG